MPSLSRRRWDCVPSPSCKGRWHGAGLHWSVGTLSCPAVQAYAETAPRDVETNPELQRTAQLEPDGMRPLLAGHGSVGSQEKFVLICDASTMMQGLGLHCSVGTFNVPAMHAKAVVPPSHWCESLHCTKHCVPDASAIPALQPYLLSPRILGSTQLKSHC